MNTTWLTLPASDLGRGIARGDIDPVALTETFLAAIAAHPDADRIYTVVTKDRARAEAAAASRRAADGTRRGLLDGVPVSWKDLFDSAGTVTAAGSRALSGRVPQEDAALLVRATQAGLVCLGKTTMSELAFSGLGYNPMIGTPPNGIEADRIPGGSSSGAAASVALGLAAAAMGSDTGGSVRVPAAWNGLVGLKSGVTPDGERDVKVLDDTGMVPLCPSFDTAGPLCRTVEDAAELFAALGGAHPIEAPTPSALTLAVLETAAMDNLDQAVAAGFAASVERLERAGVTVVRERMLQLDTALDLSPTLFPYEAYKQWGDFVDRNEDAMFAPIVERIRGGAGLDRSHFDDAWRRLLAVRAMWNAQFDRYDAVICPTVPILPPKLERIATSSDSETGREFYVRCNLMALRNTRIGNLMGLSGLSLPTAVPMVGLLLNTPGGDEARLLGLGARLARLVAGAA